MIRLVRRGEESSTESALEKARRFWEVDAARGVAILMMVLYHLVYDLDTFGGYAIESTSGGWGVFADITAASFLFLVGVALAISHSRARRLRRATFGKYLSRGLRILGYGMVLTVVSLALDLGVIAFGILHLIGISIILVYPLLRYRSLNLLLGLGIIAAGMYMMHRGVYSESPWLLPLGVVPENLPMPDYRPLLPWFGVVLLGLFSGNLAYGGEKRLALFAGNPPLLARPLLPLGRNSLFIYLVHQPVMVALLAAFGILSSGRL